MSEDPDLAAALVLEATQQLNRALHAHRTAAGDPHIADVDPSRAASIRFGFGTGEEVADGRWHRAQEMPEGERRGLLRRDYESMRPQERIAAVLAGRELVAPHEELILRARGDVDCGRLATAALGLHTGLEALLRRRETLPTKANESLDQRLHEALADAAAARRSVLAGADDADLDLDRLDRAVRAGEAAMRQRVLD